MCICEIRVLIDEFGETCIEVPRLRTSELAGRFQHTVQEHLLDFALLQMVHVHMNAI